MSLSLFFPTHTCYVFLKLLNALCALFDSTFSSSLLIVALLLEFGVRMASLLQFLLMLRDLNFLAS